MAATHVARDQIELKGDGFVVRHARPEDLEAARANIQRVLLEDLNIPHTPMWHWDVDNLGAVYLENPRHALFVAIDDASGQVIATTGIQAGGPKSPPFDSSLTNRYGASQTAQVYRVYIQREHRRRGIASHLVEAARRFVASEGGYTRLYLHTDPKSDGAEPFWRSVARLTHDSRHDDSVSGSVHFELPLNTPLPKFRDGSTGPDWQDWFIRWDWQQESYIPLREERFGVMLDVLGRVCGDEFTVIDLMCGPGAIAKRVTERFPKARVIAVDLDPVLMELGRQAVGDAGGRIRWEERDFRDPQWWSSIGHDGQVDAVLSTTAIHWLPAGGIIDLYRQLAGIIRPGGLFLNGDQMDFVQAQPVLRRVTQQSRADHREHASGLGAESWEDWWLNLRKEPGLAALLEERDRRFSWRGAERETAIGATRSDTTAPVSHTHYEVHRAGLLDAGFSEVDVLWQHLGNRVLAAVR